MLRCHIAWNFLPHCLTHTYELKELLATQDITSHLETALTS